MFKVNLVRMITMLCVASAGLATNNQPQTANQNNGNTPKSGTIAGIVINPLEVKEGAVTIGGTLIIKEQIVITKQKLTSGNVLDPKSFMLEAEATCASSYKGLVPEGPYKQSFDNICDKQKLSTVSSGSWFDVYWAKVYVSANPISYATDVLTHQKNFYIHREKVLKYITLLEKWKADYFLELASVYQPYRMYTIMSFICSILALKDCAPYKVPANADTTKANFLAEVEKMKSLVQLFKIASSSFSLDLFAVKPGTPRAKGTYSDTVFPKITAMDVQLGQIHIKMCQLLQTIVMAFSGHPDLAATYNGLKKVPGQVTLEGASTPRDMIFAFYRAFYYIVDGYRPATCETFGMKTLRGAVSMSLGGFDIEDPKLALPKHFFSLAFFNVVDKSLLYQDIIKYDQFMLLGLTGDADLIVLEEWQFKKIVFHAEFFSEFKKEYVLQDNKLTSKENPNLDINLINVPITDPQKSQIQVYVLYSYIMLYKSYVYLRKRGDIKRETKLVEIRKIIYMWLVNQDYTETNIFFADGFFTWAEVHVYWAATISYLCQLMEDLCLGKDLENAVTLDQLKRVKFDRDTLPRHIFRGMYFTPRIHELLRQLQAEKDAQNFYNELVALKYVELTKDCKEELREFPPSVDVSADLRAKKQRVVYYTTGCTDIIYKSYVDIIKKYLLPTLKDDLFDLYFSKYREVIDHFPSIDVRGILRYLTIRYFRQVALQKASGVKVEELHKNFPRLFVAVYVVSKVQSVKIEYSMGLYNFFSYVLQSQRSLYGWMFRLVPDQERYFYADIYFLLYSPMYKNIGTASEINTNMKSWFDTALPEFFSRAPTTKKEDFKKYVANLESAIATPKSSEGVNWYELSSMVFTLELLSMNLDFYDFVSRTSSYATEMDQAGGFPPLVPFATFYAFIYKLRINMDAEVVNLHRYVLDKLTYCMGYTSGTLKDEKGNPRTVKDPISEDLCHLSYRKYAELYFIYKLYLILKKGYNDLTFENFDLNILPIRAGSFFYLAGILGSVGKKVSDICNTPANTNTRICQVYSIFSFALPEIKNNLMTLSTFSDYTNLLSEKFKLKDKTGPLTAEKFQLLLVTDALYQVTKGIPMMVNIFEGRFNPMQALTAEGQKTIPQNPAAEKFLWALKDTPEDRAQMTEYLRLSFKKRFIEPEEVQIRITVQTLLQQITEVKAKPGYKEDDVNVLSLSTLFTMRGLHSTSLIKLFLMFCNSVEDFALVTEYIVKRKVFLEIVGVENEREEETIRTIIKAMNKKFSTVVDAKDAAQIKEMIKFLRQKIEIHLSEMVQIAEANNFNTIGGAGIMDFGIPVLNDSKDIYPVMDAYNKQVIETIKVETVISTTITKESVKEQASLTTNQQILVTQDVFTQFQSFDLAGIDLSSFTTVQVETQGGTITVPKSQQNEEINADTLEVRKSFSATISKTFNSQSVNMDLASMGQIEKGMTDALLTGLDNKSLGQDLDGLSQVKKRRNLAASVRIGGRYSPTAQVFVARRRMAL